MAQPPPATLASQGSAIPVRAMPPIPNPVYVHNDNDDFKRTPTPTHVLARPANDGVDPRLTSTGDTSRAAGIPGYVPYAGQTPYNVWALYPA
jgi:hypothetical protein